MYVHQVYASIITSFPSFQLFILSSPDFFYKHTVHGTLVDMHVHHSVMFFFQVPLIKEEKGLSTLNQVERASSAKPKDKAFEKSTYMRTYVRVQYENHLERLSMQIQDDGIPFGIRLQFTL